MSRNHRQRALWPPFRGCPLRENLRRLPYREAGRPNAPLHVRRSVAARERHHAIRLPGIDHALVADRARSAPEPIPISAELPHLYIALDRPRSGMQIRSRRFSGDHRLDPALRVQPVKRREDGSPIRVVPPTANENAHQVPRMEGAAPKSDPRKIKPCLGLLPNRHQRLITRATVAEQNIGNDKVGRPAVWPDHREPLGPVGMDAKAESPGPRISAGARALRHRHGDRSAGPTIGRIHGTASGGALILPPPRTRASRWPASLPHPRGQ